MIKKLKQGNKLVYGGKRQTAFRDVSGGGFDPRGVFRPFSFLFI